MAELKLRIQPGWQQGSLTMQFVQDNVVTASGVAGAASVTQEGPVGAQTTFASDNVELDPNDPGNTTSAGIGTIQCVDVSLTIVAEEQAEIDASGNLVAADPAKQATVTAVQDTVNKIPRADQDLTDGEAVRRSKNSDGGAWIDKDNINESIRKVP